MPRFHRWLVRHPRLCFVLMTLAFVAFGLLSLDLVRLVAANTHLLSEYGWQAAMDGALWQLLELVLNAFAAVTAWLFFKLCETALLQRLSKGE
ncbi:MAG TPA: hypothetical protein VGE47_07375 [Burkholderiaceae bacterium]